MSCSSSRSEKRYAEPTVAAKRRVDRVLMETLHAAAGRTVEVFADSYVSLNGRPAVQLVDPTIDLAAEPFRPFGQPWILPAPTTDPPG